MRASAQTTSQAIGHYRTLPYMAVHYRTVPYTTVHCLLPLLFETAFSIVILHLFCFLYSSLPALLCVLIPLSCTTASFSCCCSGGDAFLSRCIWQAGYAFTDPGYSFYHWEAKSFDPGPESSRKLVRDFSAALLGACAQQPLVSYRLSETCAEE